MTITKLDGIFSGKFEVNLPGTEYQAMRIKKAGYYFPIAPVHISPMDGLFYKSANVKLWTNDDAEIRYTLDSSIPTRTSPLFTEPILITENKLLMYIFLIKY